MPPRTKLTINVDESFQHLPHAPIVEAVIDIRSQPTVAFEEATFKPQLEAKLGGYEYLDSQRTFQHEFRVEAGKPPSAMARDMGWQGLRFQSTDKKQIAQFNRNEFVLSRLEPYQSWEQLYEEGMRLWSLYVELAQPVEIKRIGLRYINRIQLPPGELRFEKYMGPAPAPPQGLTLPFRGFMHQDTLEVTGHPYAINVIRTIQPSGDSGVPGMGLILDIDAFTTEEFELNEVLLKRHLLAMRWLKNKMFFGSVTPMALKLCQ